MSQNFNSTFPFFQNSNITLSNGFVSGNYAIFPLNNLTFWNQPNNLYSSQEPAFSPNTDGTVKKEYI